MSMPPASTAQSPRCASTCPPDALTSRTMSISNTEALARVIDHREIFHDEMLTLMRRIMSGEMSPVMIAALAMGLRVRKETIGEITAAAPVVREFATPAAVCAEPAQAPPLTVGTQPPCIAGEVHALTPYEGVRHTGASGLVWTIDIA